MAWMSERPKQGARRAFSRFDRRVGVLALVAFGALGILVLQLARLSVVEHGVHRTNVERFLLTKRLLPAPRGRIIDRRGEILAADRASWDVLLAYDAIAGRWASEMARRELVAELGRSRWLELSAAERATALVQRQAKFDAVLDSIYARIMEAGGFDQAELDRRLDAVLSRAARESTSRRQALVEREIRVFGDDARLGDIDRERVASQRGSHVVLPDVPDEVAFYFQRLAEELPGTVEVEPSTRRTRPWEQVVFDLDRSNFPSPIRSSKRATVTLNGVADHIIGSTRSQVFADELARRPLVNTETGEIIDLGGYRADRDVVGAVGVERAREPALRGTRGVIERDLEKGTENRLDPVPGADTQLTIDIRLQSRIQSLFASESGLATIQQYQRGVDAEGNPRGGPLPLGYELDGAVVVLEIATGEILAAVSHPTIADGALMTPARRAIEHPEIFRPTEGVYPPGSILKPLVFCAAAAEGIVRPGDTIECKGHYFPERNDAARCWIYRPAEGRQSTHGPLDAQGALARSCNIYFYAIADRLGPERLVAWLGRFGLARAPGTGLGIETAAESGERRIQGESTGVLPSAESIAEIKTRGDRVTPILLGIGQGPLTWTPMHAASAFATIARGGRVIAPHFIRGAPQPAPVDLGIPRAAIDAALAGLRGSVNEDYGTGHHITLEGGRRERLFDFTDLDVWGKTGTATAPLLALDGNQDGTPETRVRTDHAWFVGLVAEKGASPRYAVAVLLENGGSGGKVAGPMGAAVIRAIAAEGYLGESARRGTGGVAAP
ncbi:MAG: penicillin-binding transpeptidase domain-containing protein [bacterium]|jgi:penicillin-binding protein 2